MAYQTVNQIVTDPDINLGEHHRVLCRTDGKWAVIDKRRHFADQTVFVSSDSPTAIAKAESLSGAKYERKAGHNGL